MASSGWQGSKYIYTVYSEIWGNLRIDGITHSGTDLRVWGAIRIEGKGSGCSYFNNGIYGYTEGQGDALIVGQAVNVCSGGTFDRGFDVTIHNVGVSATSYNFDTYFYACNANNCSTKYFDTRLRWTLYFDSSAVAPTGLTASLVDFGPDWADIAVSISSWGTPSGSASRYIEAAVLSTSTYGDPYKIDTRTAVMDATIRVDNSCRGSITITPNTQYWYGGHADNRSKAASTMSGQFTTLPAVPVINAIDQGHGVIAVTVTHATEGSALTITEEYSTDGGTTWTAITGGAFTVTLSTQTVITVRRSSTSGVSSTTVTVTPSFTTAIYGSVLNKSVLIDKVYAPIMAPKLVSASITPSQYTTALDSEKFVDFFTGTEAFRKEIMQGATLAQLTLDWASAQVLITITLSNGRIARVATESIASLSTKYGITATRPFGGTDTVVLSGTYETAPLSKKVAKIYASVEGKTRLVFEDPS